MSSADTGGPAFPRPASPAHQHGMHDPQKGMTLRDYFAGQAIAGILANPDISASAARCNVSTEEFREDTAAAAYAMADAMLKARDQ